MPPNRPPADDAPAMDTRSHILTIAARLLAEHGREALTTRAVVAAAGVQQPTLYRLFGDKAGLLDAVAERGLADYVTAKTSLSADPDPLADFRGGWDRHMAFGLAHPALFAIIWGDPDPTRVSPAAAAGQAALQLKVRALAATGLLRVTEKRAAGLAHAACTGAVLTLLDTPGAARDAGLAIAAREAVIEAITHAGPVIAQPGPPGAAIALKATLDQIASLTPGEKLLLAELLDKIGGESGA